MGGDPDGTIVPMGYLATGKPEVDMAGIEALTKRHSTAEVKAMLDDAGYNGERLVLLHTTDQPFYNSASLVVADALSRVGMTIDDQAMDWGTVLQRRSSKAAAGQGRLVAVRQRHAGAGVSRSAAGLAAARQWQGRVDRLARRSRASRRPTTRGWTATMRRSRRGWSGRSSWRRSNRCRSFRSAATCRARRGARGISDPLKGPAPVFWNVSKAESCKEQRRSNLVTPWPVTSSVTIASLAMRSC